MSNPMAYQYNRVKVQIENVVKSLHRKMLQLYVDKQW